MPVTLSFSVIIIIILLFRCYSLEIILINKLDWMAQTAIMSPACMY